MFAFSFRLFLGLSLLLALAPMHAGAATYTVTNANDSGDGSLRAAIAGAQDGDTIVFQPGLAGTILLSSVLFVTHDIIIQGPGAETLAVSGNNASGVFAVSAGTTPGTATISGLTIEDGNATTGAGIIVGPTATLALMGCILTNNNAMNSNGLAGEGGGLYNDRGTVRLNNCSFTNNHAAYGAGLYSIGTVIPTSCIFSDNAAASSGGGLCNVGVATLTDCTFTANTAPLGGGVGNSDLVTLVDCALNDNTASYGGGGIDNSGGSGNGSATVIGCTFTSNSTSQQGSSLYNSGTATVTDSVFTGNSGSAIYNGDVVTLTNSVFTDNNALPNDGGALYNFNAAAVINCTFTGNTAARGGAIANSDYLTLTNDILYADSGGEVGVPAINEAQMSASFCDIDEPLGSSGDNVTDNGHNIDANPRFLLPYSSGATASDLRLQPGSPCLGAGATQSQVPVDIFVSTTIPSTDVTGAVRPTPPSMGAYDANATGTEPSNGGGTSSPAILYTFPPGLQMIAFSEGYLGDVNPWAAPASQPLDIYNGLAYVQTTTLPQPGQGTWVYLTQNTPVYDTGIPAASTMSVPLNPGWNLIGNPFSVSTPVSSLTITNPPEAYTLAQAEQQGVASATLYTYPASTPPGGNYTSIGPNDNLQPFTGYWLFADQPCTLIITQPAATDVRGAAGITLP